MSESNIVISVKIHKRLLKQFEKQLRRDGFRSRNEAINFLIRTYVDIKSRDSFIKKLLSVIY